MTIRTKPCSACKINQLEIMFRKDQSRCMVCEIAYGKHEIANLKRKIEEMSAPRNRWTDVQLSALIHVIVYEGGGFAQASKISGRSIDKCRVKADALGLRREKTIPKHFHTDEEIAKVYYCMYVRGLSTYLTARALNYRTHNIVIGINNRHIKENPSIWAGRWQPPADFSWPTPSPKERAWHRSRSSPVSMVRNKT
jgi:hypothetical protein